MLSDKDVKKKFKKVTTSDPNKYYATKALKELGFKRKHCKCGMWFWNSTDSKVCGEPVCSGGFRFFENNPAKKKLSYVQVWEEFEKLLESKGYLSVDRYPVVARWRDDTDFVQASIYNFQPWVVSDK